MENKMARSEFVYVTYIKTTPEKLWQALINPELMKQYWAGMHIKTDWKPGSPWQMMFPDGSIADVGEVIEFKPFKRLKLKWRNEWKAKLKAEGYSRCRMDIEPSVKAVKLTVSHTIGKDRSEFIKAVAGGWPFICSNLKSLLETGTVAMKEYII